MNYHNLKIRKVKKTDAQRIWEIRNYESARKYSGNQDKVLLKNHLQWFNNRYFLGDGKNICLILDFENDVIGYCRFDFQTGDKYIISIALDYDFQRKGLGAYFLKRSLEIIDDKEILATINKKNIASYNLFLKNNFILDKEDEDNYYLILKR